MQLYAQNIMTPSLITLRPEMGCDEVAELFVTHHISGAPVVNNHGVLIGMFSLSDLLRSAEFYAHPDWNPQDVNLDRLLAKEGLHLESLAGGYVSDYMTHSVVTAEPQTTVEDLAQRMYCNRVHRVVIVEPNEQKPVGIVTTFDLLKLIAMADTLEPACDQHASWYSKKFAQIRYETIPTLK